MATTPPESAVTPLRRSKPAVGHPLLFSFLLAAAALGTLLLLVTGPSIGLPLAIGSAAALITLVVLTWIFTGPRL
ncbi:hypothetical protein CFK39_12900 [Brachybacterium avium]|uniref:Uncharacterized protein n=1 Tax=Brachybacterium avium TaxID=2017485 RepID=A0A220UEM7_9MICO|nr:hypothetical protein [Brachybacterium avium]ASK66555.1 hypothetical protein CFK39_12900 [Brachybacterium avium]